MKAFIGSTATLLTYDTHISETKKMDSIGYATILLADNELSAWTTYKDSQFDMITIVDEDADPEYVYNYDNTSGFTDETTAATNDTTNDIHLTGATGAPEVGDIVYIGRDEAFDYLRIDVYTANSDNTYVWEYWNGSAWSALNETDDTKTTYSFEADGLIVWERPSNWATTTVDSQSAYWVRARISSAGSSLPTGTRIYAGASYWEGRVEDVEFERNVTTLKCCELSKELEDITLVDDSTHTADFNLHEGIVNAADATTITDSDASWTADEWIGKGVLINPGKVTLNPSAKYTGIRVYPTMATRGNLSSVRQRINYYGGPTWSDNKANTFVLEYKFEGDSADISQFLLSFKFKVDSGGAAGKLQIYDYDTPTWEDVTGGTISLGDWIEDTDTFDVNPDHYINTDGTMKIRINVTACTGTYNVEYNYAFFTLSYSNEFDGSQFFDITDNTATVLTVDNDPASENVKKGDEYIIGERVDTILETFFSDYSSTLNISVSAETSSKYSARNFEGMNALAAEMNLIELDDAHWWLGRGRKFYHRTTIASSGLTIDEDLMDPSFRILRSSTNRIVKEVNVYGQPETLQLEPIKATYTNPSPIGEIVLNIFRWAITTVSEAYNLAKSIATRHKDRKSNIKGYTLVQNATTRALDVGKSVNFEFDTDGDAVDEITESNIVVRAITREQESSGRLKTTIELGYFPIESDERFLHNLGMSDVRTNMHSQGRDDAYTARYLGLSGNESPIYSLDDLRDRGVDSLQGTTTVGTTHSNAWTFTEALTTNKDLNADDDVCVDDDAETADDIYFGASSFVIYEDSNDIVMALTAALRLDNTNGYPGIKFYEDATHYGTVFWDEANNTLNLGSTHTLIYAEKNFYVRDGYALRVYDSQNNEYAEIRHGGTNAIIAQSTGKLMLRPLDTVMIQHTSTQGVLGATKALHIQADYDDTDEDVFYVEWDGSVHADGPFAEFDEEDDLQLIKDMDMTNSDTWHVGLKNEKGLANLQNMISLNFGAHKQSYDRIQLLEKRVDLLEGVLNEKSTKEEEPR